jgi:hypothetical protein
MATCSSFNSRALWVARQSLLIFRSVERLDYCTKHVGSESCAKRWDCCVWMCMAFHSWYMYVCIYICIIIWLCIMYMTFMYVLGSTVSKVCCDQRPLGSGTLTWHCLRSRFFSPNFAFYWPCECTGVYRNPNPWGYLSFTLVSFEVRQDRVGKGGSRTAMLEFEL